MASGWPDRLYRRGYNALARFRSISPARLARDVRRARRLRKATHLSLPAAMNRRERIVVAMTTVPERSGMIEPVLRSLLDQTVRADRVLLAWPERSRRTGLPYPAPPPLPAGVELLPCTDQGPATKLLPALRAEPDAAIVVVDDDVVYPVDFVEALTAEYRAGARGAVGWRGWRLRPGTDGRDLKHVFGQAVGEPTRVDVLLGTWGYLVPPAALDDAVHDFDGWPPEVRWVDDIWVSGHLARRDVPRYVVPARGLPLETAASDVAALTFGINRSGRNDRIAIDAFAAWW